MSPEILPAAFYGIRPILYDSQQIVGLFSWSKPYYHAAHGLGNNMTMCWTEDEHNADGNFTVRSAATPRWPVFWSSPCPTAACQPAPPTLPLGAWPHRTR